jgi:hypothetical protein
MTSSSVQAHMNRVEFGQRLRFVATGMYAALGAWTLVGRYWVVVLFCAIGFAISWHARPRPTPGDWRVVMVTALLAAGGIGLVFGATTAVAATPPAVAKIRADVQILYLSATGQKADPHCPAGAPPSCLARQTCEDLRDHGRELVRTSRGKLRAVGKEYRLAGERCVAADPNVGMRRHLVRARDILRTMDPSVAQQFGPAALEVG